MITNHSIFAVAIQELLGKGILTRCSSHALKERSASEIVTTKRFPHGTISLHRCLASKHISCALIAATLSAMACPGIGASSFIVNTRLHPSWRAVRLADLMLICLYRSNTTCSTCVVSIPFQILATTAVVNADTFAVSADQDTVPAIDNGDDRRLRISFFTRNMQFILQHRFTCCPHFSVISKHGCRV